MGRLAVLGVLASLAVQMKGRRDGGDDGKRVDSVFSLVYSDKKLCT